MKLEPPDRLLYGVARGAPLTKRALWHNNLFIRRHITSNYSRISNEKYIGFDIDSKKVAACVVQASQAERYRTISADVHSMRRFLEKGKSDDSVVHIVFEISGQAGFIYDSLIDCVDSVTVANPSKMTVDGRDIYGRVRQAG